METKTDKRVGCFYTTDIGYLVPTLISAGQMKQHASSSNLDVFVLYFGEQDAIFDASRVVADEFNIKLVHLRKDVMAGMHMTYARFNLHRFVDLNYDEIVYMDGDTQVAGPISEYLAADLGESGLMATPDPMALRMDESGDFWTRKSHYFSSIGIDRKSQLSYFNAGILKAAPARWIAVSEEAIRLYHARKQDYVFSDQDILNMIVGSNYQSASFQWNFPAFLVNTDIERIVQPKIYHFMSNPRPWHGPLPPWGRRWSEPYVHFMQRFPFVSTTLRPLSRMKILKYFAQQQYKAVFERPGWHSSLVRSRVRQFEKDVTWKKVAA